MIQGQNYVGLAHWCPACKEIHVFATQGKNSSGATWSFDGNLDVPTFHPSMLITINGKGQPHHDPEEATDICHYFLHGGKINFCGDCTHEMKGQQGVELPDLPEYLQGHAR